MGGRVKAMKGLNLFHSIPKTSVKEENNTLARRGQSCQLFFFSFTKLQKQSKFGGKKALLCICKFYIDRSRASFGKGRRYM